MEVSYEHNYRKYLSSHISVYFTIPYLSSAPLASPEMKLTSSLKCDFFSKCSVLNMALMIVSVLFDLISVWFSALFKFRMIQNVNTYFLICLYRQIYELLNSWTCSKSPLCYCDSWAAHKKEVLTNRFPSFLHVLLRNKHVNQWNQFSK